MIDEYKFGMFKIDGKKYYDDVKILNNRIKLWECHSRVITSTDIDELLVTNPQVIIIGLGAGGLISVADDVRDTLRMRKIAFFAEKNLKACDLYNKALREGKRVAAIFPVRG